MTLELLLAILIAAAGLVLSSMFSGIETGLYTINRVRLMVRASHGEVQALRLLDLMRNPNRMLSTLLIGNNIANYAGSFGVAAIFDLFGFSPVTAIIINAAVLVPLLFIFGETLPKDLFRTFTDRWSYTFSGFLMWCQRLLMAVGLVPIVHGFGVLAGRMLGADSAAAMTARQRISQLIKEGVSVGILSETQVTLADRALAMRHQTVGSEMIPWHRVVWLREDATSEQRAQLLKQCKYSRAPVLNRRGRVVGVVSLLDLALDPDASISALMREATTLSAEQSVSDALREMRRAGSHLGVVVRSGAGRPVGLVTLKDLVEPLVGELIELH